MGFCALLGASQGAQAASNGTFNFTANSPAAGKATITSCVASPCPSTLTIPATITSGASYQVAAIGANAFQNQTSITSLTLPGARSRATPGAIITTFRADGPGIVTQSVVTTSGRARAGGRAICTVTATIARAGPVRLVCPLSNSAKQLRVTRAFSVTVSTTFRLDGGALQRAAAAVRLARQTTPKPHVSPGPSAVTG